MSQPPVPILEFDPDRRAILEPKPEDPRTPFPSHGVLCFFHDVLQDLSASGELRQFSSLGSEMGVHPVYQITHNGVPILVFHPGVGAPLAAKFLEELIASGLRFAVACSGCGVLKPEIPVGHPVIVTAAVRDEGTSYHYLPPAAEVAASQRGIAALQQAFEAAGLPHRLGKSWSTDAIYRETAARRERRIAQGCDVVEMEAAALYAVAQFRGIEIAQVVYGGDLVVPGQWDKRGWDLRRQDRLNLFRLSLEACSRL